MKLSIIIRTYNRLEYMIRTIISIDKNCGLPKDDYEIIVVDQNSHDGTREWLVFNSREGYYPIKSILLRENVGDGRGMQVGINIAKGEYIAQHDNDLELITSDYFLKLILTYEYLETIEQINVCAVSGSHKQGIDLGAKPHQFAKLRYPNNFLEAGDERYSGYLVSWVHGSFIFRKKFSKLKFNKRGCNSWCSTWWDEGCDSFNCKNISFWHIDSGQTGAHVKKQEEKFPSYNYIRKNYGRFL